MEIKLRDYYKTIKAKTDKGTRHDYINAFYCPEFTPIKDDAVNIVEIGIHNGASLRLFRGWFSTAKITGIDILKPKNWEAITGVRVIWGDAYSEVVCEMFDDNSIDYLIDDGPHTIESQIKGLQMYWSKIKPGGKFIVEDPRNIDRDKHLFSQFASDYKCKHRIIDLRSKTKRVSDDVLVVYEKPLN